MQVPQHSRSGKVGFNMTPMIDVVFLLIIFFLVSSHLAKQEAQMALPLPTAASGSKADDEVSRRLTVNVLHDGRMLLAGKHVTPAQLEQRLKARASESGVDCEVRIRGDRSVAYQHVEPIMLACAKSGIWKVTFAVHSKAESD